MAVGLIEKDHTLCSGNSPGIQRDASLAVTSAVRGGDLQRRLYVDTSQQLRANTGRSPMARGTRHIDPNRAFPFASQWKERAAKRSKGAFGAVR
jgi:hypothetical protein